MGAIFLRNQGPNNQFPTNKPTISGQIIGMSFDLTLKGIAEEGKSPYLKALHEMWNIIARRAPSHVDITKSLLCPSKKDFS